MQLHLSQNQRIIVAFSYLVILFALFKIVGGSIGNLAWDTNIDSSIWFYSGAFMIILGTYIVEPFFTKPSDAIANSTAVLIALFGLSNKQDLCGYTFIFYYATTILILGIITIILKDAKTDFWRKMSRSLFWFLECFGASKVIFSVVYLSAAYSYFAIPEKMIAFISIITLWICLTFFDVIGLVVERVSKLLNYWGNKIGDELGKAIGCENPLLYKVEIDYTKHGSKPVKYGDLVALETSVNAGSIGMVVDTKYLLNKRWLSIYLVQDESGDILKINLRDKKMITEPKSIFAKENLVYLLDISILEESLKTKIEGNPLYKDREQFIGYVSSGSNINTINFSIVREANKLEQKISEGAILKTLIYGQETLYQVINGNAKEEHLENFDRHGFIIGIARKLGKYKKDTKDLDVNKWMPSVFSPLFYAFSGTVSEARIKEIAQNSIGRLPDTDLEIPIKSFGEIVTHNTAILGILGIGKSCLTFEIIQKVITYTSAKVICFDITGEYFDELTTYGCNPKTLNDSEIQLEFASNYETINKDIHKGGNHAQFRQKIETVLTTFLDNADDKLLIINPENYDVSRQTNDIKNKKIGPGPNDWQEQAPMSDLTLVEKTRIIAEVILDYSKKKGKSKNARCLLVFEEAHSLIPEWNSVANESDKSATNGTAKVILQGRKYGLGILVITQRTANVSKSILNQCNTIFALRVFDDTGKGFLENYIGRDYADTLATLEERHVIVIGKGLRLKQPVIIQLNDRKIITEQHGTR